MDLVTVCDKNIMYNAKGFKYYSSPFQNLTFNEITSLLRAALEKNILVLMHRVLLHITYSKDKV